MQIESCNVIVDTKADTKTDTDSDDNGGAGESFVTSFDDDFPKEDFGSHQFKLPDLFLAHDLNQLTFKERDEINEEVHGVRDQYQHMVEETPEFLHDSLQKLSVELKAIPTKKQACVR